jgi:hypothetical protein
MILQELDVKLGLLIDEFQKNAAKVKDEANTIEGTFKQLKGALAAMGIFAFMKGAVAEFADSERGINRLQFTLKNLGGDWQAATREVMAYTAQAEALTGFNADDMIPTITELAKMTGNYQEALALMPDILDITASGTMTMGEAMNAVGQAYIGNQRVLGMLASQFGVAQQDAKNFGDVMVEVRKKVEGQAEAQRGVSRDMMDFNNAWKQFQQNAGGSISSLVHLGDEMLKFSLPVAAALDNTRKAQDKILMAPIDFISKKIADWLGVTHKAKSESEKMVDDLIAAGKNIDKRKEWSGDNARPTVGRLSKDEQALRMSKAEKAAKGEYEINKQYGDQYMALMKSNSVKLSVLYGKNSSEYKQHKSEEIKITRDVENAKMALAEKTVANNISAGRATDMDLLEVMRGNAEKVRQMYGQNSAEYQDYLSSLTAQTLKAFSTQVVMAQSLAAAMSDGFSQAFQIMFQEGANAEKIIGGFARAMGKSLLGSIASAVDAKVAEGIVGYFSNMLMGGPWGGPVVQAYSLPMLAAMTAAAGAMHGMAAMMADGGTMTRPGMAILAEKASGEPETAIPLSRMDEVFQKYSHFIGKRQGGAGSGGKGTTVIVQRVNDNRGAIVASSSYDKGRAAKNLGQILVERGVISKR